MIIPTKKQYQEAKKIIINYELKTDMVQKILEKTSRITKIPLSEIKGKSRKREVVRARQMSMFVSKKITSLGVVYIGYKHNRNHATVTHAVKTIESDLKYAPDRHRLRCMIDRIRNIEK